MSLTREDMLRELELLPVWRLRAPMLTDVVVIPKEHISTPMVADSPAQETENLSVEVAAVVPEVNAAVAEGDVELATESPVNVPKAEVSAALITAPWFLLCLQAEDAASQQLLQNIIRALKLPSEEIHFSQQMLQQAQVKSRFGVLFGLDAANQFLGTSHAEIASIRGQLLTHQELTYVITHHPQTMLENPALKKEVWHDLCLLLAKK